MKLNGNKFMGLIGLSCLGSYMLRPYYNTYHFGLLFIMYIIVALIIYVFIYEIY